MRRKQAFVKLNNTMKIFGSDMAQCHFERNLALDGFRPKHIAMVSALQKKPARNDERVRVRRLGVAVVADDLRKTSNYYIAIGKQGAKDDKLAKALLQALNSSFLWILTRAYETFERFIRRIYADIGYLDRNLWRCSDFGSIAMSDISKLPWQWYWDYTRNKHDISKMLSRMRSIFADLKKLETKNSRRINLEHWQKVIELFRHQIVHAEGIVPSDFIDKVGEEIGRKPRNGVIQALGGNHFQIWFKEISGGNVLWLVNDMALRDKSYHFIEKPLNVLLEVLATHGCLVYSMAANHFGFAPFWE